MRRHERTFLAVVLWLSAGVGLSLDLHAPVADAAQSKPVALESESKVPDFILLDQDGKRFDSAALRGKVIVLDFIYTTCTDVCPLFTANFARLQRQLATEHRSEVFFISITTDPEIDSPKVLQAYAQRYGADFSNWAFLTGTEAQLKEVWKGFGIRVIHEGRGRVRHDSLTTLIDRQGMRRFNHFGEKWRLEDVERDLLLLLAETAKRKR